MFREDVFMKDRCAECMLAILTVAFFAGFSPVLAAQAVSESPALAPYASCQFPDGLQVVETDPLAPGITSREVDTDTGPRRIDMKAGVRVMFAYPDTDFYANVKAELLPAANYPQLKQFLLDNFQYLAHSNIVNSSLHSPLNGFEAHGLDREKLEGGVLGIYLLFDDPAHVVTTIYLLNHEPQNRKFQTLEEYRQLRDRFLVSYSACIRKNEQNR
jgi:hypothetical protein